MVAKLNSQFALKIINSAQRTSGMGLSKTYSYCTPFSCLMSIDACCLCIRNGRWRSEWTTSFTPGSSAEIKGLLRVQVGSVK